MQSTTLDFGNIYLLICLQCLNFDQTIQTYLYVTTVVVVIPWTLPDK